jgi:uncharacterized membrane protein YbhN (UPF0104 family)
VKEAPGTILPPAPARPFLERHRWLWWVAWAVGTACVVAFLRSFDLRAAWTHIATANPGWLALAVLANFVTLPLMAEQWVRLLPRTAPARWSVLWEVVTLSMASMNTLPFGGGHAVAVGLLAGRGVTRVSGAVSLLALEQLCEGVSKVVLLLVALAAAPLPTVLQRATWILTLAVAAGFAALLWVVNHPPGGGDAPGWRARWAKHLEVARRPRVFLFATLLSVAMKGGGLVAVYAVQRSLGVDLPFADTPLVLAAVTFATMMAVSPGNVGLYELAAIAAYRLLGIPAGQAAALALVLHACFLIPMVGTGYGLMLWRVMSRR